VNLARLLDNRTPMRALCVPLDDRHGHELLVCVAKLTWHVTPAGEATLHVPQRPVRISDSHWGDDDPGAGIRLPSDVVEEKPGTDVLLVGTARPPDRGPDAGRLSQLDVTLQVGESDRLRVDKQVRVYGQRVWQKAVVGVKPGPSAPLGPTPLTYDQTWGGMDDSDPEQVLRDDRNPLGSGVARDKATLVDQPAPVLEDLNAPITGRNPAPAGFGALARHWEPRAARHGTLDENWRRERAPIRPIDFDPRAHCCAPDDQHCDPPLRGDENVAIEGVVPGRRWAFRLPFYAPVFEAQLVDEDGPRSLATHLDTFLIDGDEGVAELTWRAGFILPRKAERIRWLRLGGHPPLADELRADLRTKLQARGRTA